MNKMMLVALLASVSGCYSAHGAQQPADAGPAPSDAGCVFQWGCVGEACPAQDVQDGIWFPCELATDPSSFEDRDR